MPAHAGATSFIVVDLPSDVRPELRRIQLVAPTSTDERIRLAATVDRRLALPRHRHRHDGSTGRPRARASPRSRERARAVTDVPLYAGFGISTAEHARAAAELVDGIAVGSRAVEAAETGEAELSKLVASLRAGLDAA